jgi:uroporphyrinogen decarboxylase
MEMTPRERLLATVAFEPVDRPFRMETIGYWKETVQRWQGEGLPPEVDNELAALLFFGIDMQLPISIGAHEHPGFEPLFEEEVLEQGDRYTIKRNLAGQTVKVFTDGSSALPGFIDAPVKDRESWEEVKARLDPDSPGRIEPWLPFAELAKTQPWPLCVYVPGLFGTHRHLLGFTGLMLAYRKQPELLHEISRHWVTLWKTAVSRIHEKKCPDLVSFWEDMCYKNGPMIGPGMFGTFMLPYYKELVGFLRNELEVPAVGVDTDGNMTLLIEPFVRSGVNLIWPFEVQAGMDVVKVREQWPDQFAIWGGMDKRALFTDKETIEAEVMRVVPPMLKARGYIPSIDHAVPPEVSLDNWKYFLELVRDTGERFCE